MLPYSVGVRCVFTRCPRIKSCPRQPSLWHLSFPSASGAGSPTRPELLTAPHSSTTSDVDGTDMATRRARDNPVESVGYNGLQHVLSTRHAVQLAPAHHAPRQLTGAFLLWRGPLFFGQNGYPWPAPGTQTPLSKTCT